MNATGTLIALGTLVRREITRILRIWSQTLLPPAITMTLYFLIFGKLIGSRVGEMAPGISYIEYIAPGLVMMSVIQNAYGNISSSFFGAKFQRFVEEMLVAPLSYVEMIAGSLAVVVLRSTITAIGILVMGLAFGATKIESIGLFLFWVISISAVFGLMGIIIGLWAKSFEQLAIIPSLVVTPGKKQPSVRLWMIESARSVESP